MQRARLASLIKRLAYGLEEKREISEFDGYVKKEAREPEEETV